MTNQNFRQSLLVISLAVMPESESSQRGQRKVFISIGKKSEYPIFQECSLAQLYECEAIGSLIDDYADRTDTALSIGHSCQSASGLESVVPFEPIPTTSSQHIQPTLF
jgi:hypothetical protein